MALEEYLKQVRETWTNYTVDLVNYQNKCRLIKCAAHVLDYFHFANVFVQGLGRSIHQVRGELELACRYETLAVLQGYA